MAGPEPFRDFRMSLHPTDRPKRVAIPWYTPENFDETRQAMDDPHAMPPAYAAWLEQALRAERQLQREGCAVVRVPLILAEFRAYCGQLGLPLVGLARMSFADERARGPQAPD